MPSSLIVPWVGESRQPRMCISVDLPLPDGPMMEMNSPSSISSDHIVQRADLLIAEAVNLADVAEFDQGHSLLELE